MLLFSGMSGKAYAVGKKSIVVDKTGFGYDAFSLSGFWQINELFDSSGWLAVGVHEERAVDRVGVIFDGFDVSLNAVNKNGLD